MKTLNAIRWCILNLQSSQFIWYLDTLPEAFVALIESKNPITMSGNNRLLKIIRKQLTNVIWAHFACSTYLNPFKSNFIVCMSVFMCVCITRARIFIWLNNHQYDLIPTCGLQFTNTMLFILNTLFVLRVGGTLLPLVHTLSVEWFSICFFCLCNLQIVRNIQLS